MPTKTRPIFKNLYDKIVFESEERGEVRGKEIGKEIGKEEQLLQDRISIIRNGLQQGFDLTSLSLLLDLPVADIKEMCQK
jgi:predicted transposase YdaD